MSKRAKQRSIHSQADTGSHFGVAARPSSSPRRGHWLTRAAFGIAVAVVIARLFMTETIRSAITVFPGAPAVPAGPGPSAGLLLDLFAGLCPLLVLLRRWVDPAFTLRASWSAWLFIALGAWAVISTTWASDRFAAAVSGCHLLAAAGVVWAVAQICRTPAHLRLTAGLCAGLLGVLLAHGLWHQLVERQELKAEWENNRESLLAARNVQPGTFEYIQFENKILRGEAMGFSASPNTYAALLVVLGLITLGACAQMLQSRRWVAAAVAMFLLLITAAVLPLTQSRTGYLTAVLGVILLALAAAFGSQLRRRATLFYLLGALGLLGVIAFVVGYGVSRGTLFHDSLNFRWRYWVGALEVWRSRPLLGAGWENFGLHYLAVRSPEATEEIKDPHNFLVRFMSELGIVGVLLAIAWTAATWWRITRPMPQPAARDSSADSPTSPLTHVLPVVVAVAAGFFLNMLASLDWSQDSSYLMFESFRIGVYFCVALALAASVWLRLVRQEPESRLVFDASSAPLMRLGLVVGLGMFFVHNLIDFAMFEVGPMFLMSLLLGVAIAPTAPVSADEPARQSTPHPRGRQVARVALTIGGAAWLIGAIALVIPVVSSEAVAAEADESLRKSVSSVAASGYESAFQNAIRNGDYAYRAGIAWRWAGDVARAKAMFDSAIAANPLNAGYRVARAELARSLRPPANQLAADDYAAAVKLDPNNAQNRIEYAAALEALNQLREAAEQLRIVLELNDRLTKEERKRLPEAKVQEIQKRIEALAARVR